jgi:integrase
MGWVERRTTRAGKIRFTAMYRDIKGAKRSAGTYSTERLAARAWQRAENDLAASVIGDRKRTLQTLSQYVETAWFPNHVMEETTREHYAFLLNRYVLPELGGMRLVEILPVHVREWVTRLQSLHGARPPTIRKCKVILDAILTAALNDQITFLHAGKGVKTPPVASRPRPIMTARQFGQLYAALDNDVARLVVETAIESGLRWGELTELRVKDLDLTTGVLTVSRAVVHLRAAARGEQPRFIVKEYPKDREWRRVRVAGHLVRKLHGHIDTWRLRPDDLLFDFRQITVAGQSGSRKMPDPQSLGVTEPNTDGRQYSHGTTTAYNLGGCRCQPCRDAMAAYRAARRQDGKDRPRSPRLVVSDGHISSDWFRSNIWRKALAQAQLGIHVTPHGLRHAHASWLLAGGADIQVVKERLGHGSITTTQRYLQTLPDTEDAALNALAAVRGVKS